MQKVNLETWLHRDTYLLFNDLDLPFYSVTSQVNITRILEKAEKKTDFRFSQYVCMKLQKQQILSRRSDIEIWKTERPSMKKNHELGVIYVSCVPWMTFTDGSLTMPVNVHAHHGFVYGKHIAEFFHFLEGTSLKD